MRKITATFTLGALVGLLTGASSAQALPESLPLQSLSTETSEITINQEVSPVEQDVSLRELLLSAALAQIGTVQDCTDLIQNSLAALGITQRRDQGGFDYGVQQLAVFGTQIPWEEAQPGDIAIIGPDNGGHVWMVLDPATGEGVHGGWEGFNTVVTVGRAPLSQHAVYRING